MKRIFIAIDISEEARGKTAAYIELAKRRSQPLRIGWERPEKLHLTLRFLGDVDDATLSEVNNAVRAAAKAATAFELRLGGTGVFPERGDARILWIGFEPNETLNQVAAGIEAACRTLGFDAVPQKFSPHLTIARLREPRKAGRLSAGHRSYNFEPVSWQVNELVIYESHLLPTGSIYTTAAKYPLKPA